MPPASHLIADDVFDDVDKVIMRIEVPSMRCEDLKVGVTGKVLTV